MNYATLEHNGDAIYDYPLSKVIAQEMYHYYEAGSYLPSIQALARRFAVDWQTVNSAINELVAAGLVERHDNDAIFVPLPAVSYVLGKNARFAETFFASGKTISSKVLYKTVISANGGIAERLRITEDTPVIKLEVLRTVENGPFCVVSHFLVSIQGIEQEIERYDSGSLYTFFADLGIELYRGFSLINVALPQEEDAAMLQISPTVPILRVKSLHFDTDTGIPVEYAISRFRADQIQLSI